ncbi:ABC protein [Mycena floridula]|nr:ABC protein [Mycena floridula]
MLNDVSKESDKTVDEQSDPEKNDSHTINRIELDSGEERCRYRKKWWQLWVPKNVPPPAPLSLSEANVTPYATASWFSKMTYSWITPIMVLGYQRTLQATDLWKMDQSQESGILSRRLNAAWEARVDKARRWNSELDQGKIDPSFLARCRWNLSSLMAGRRYKEHRATLEDQWRRIGGRRSPSLAWALNDVFGRQFWLGGAFKVVADTTQLMGPLLVKSLINFAKARATAKQEGLQAPAIGRGIGMAIGLFIIVVVTSVTQHQFWWHSMATGVLARGAMVSCIYQRGVMLNGKSRTLFSNSDLVNHISTDVSRMDAASQFFHPIWTAPIQVLVCLMILISQLGPSALAGFLLFLFIAPLQERMLAHRVRIRRESMKFTDKRAKVLLELLGAMRVVKFFSYEIPFLKRISEIRWSELQGIKNMHHVVSANTAFAYSIPVLAATLAFVTYSSTSKNFDVAVVFSSFSLFQLLRQPMMFLPRALSATADVRNAFERLEKLFLAEQLTAAPFIVDPMQKMGLAVNKATFEWESVLVDPDTTKDSPDSESDDHTLFPFRVQDIDMAVPRGSLAAIVGRVGSGKSSLLQGLLGEMRKVSGEFSFGGRVAYCPQTAWIQNATLRENILFGRPYEEDRYWKIIEIACLIPDLELLPAGDLTEIGEKGINLSGGQKQRVNIARALYYDADVVLFDDPLSAVDAHVGKSLFHGAIQQLAKEGKTVILVTHALHFLSHCDYIYAMTSDGTGRIAEHGAYKELILKHGEFARLDKEFGGVQPETESSKDEEASKLQVSETAKLALMEKNKAGSVRLEGRLIVKERRTTGSVPLKVYASYLGAGRGFLTMPFIILAILLMQGSQIANSYTLVWWQANTFQKPFSFYQILYAFLGISQACFTFLLGFAMDIMSTLVSQNLHHKSIRNIFYAPMSFFDTTPTGRIMGVFGKDIDTIDNQLPVSMRLFVLTMANVTGSVIIISALEHYFIIVAFVVFLGYTYFAKFYRASARELKRLDAILRSVLYSHFSESLTGLPTIRSYNEVPRFIRENRSYIDLENRALFLTVTNQRWLAVRLDFCGGIMVFCVALFAVSGVAGISPGQIGLVLTYTTQLTQLCGMVTRQSAEVENYMNSVERVVHYSRGDRIDQEAPHEIPDKKPAPEWPTHGAISFKEVSMTYRPGLPNVLHGVSMDIKGGEKIGVVGRTGAGKSSLVLTLLRIVEFSGSVVIDGVDISKIGLKDLRSKISIIPQDPTLFSGTVRSNLDPFELHDDALLWDALRRSFLVDRDRQSPDSSSAELNNQKTSSLGLESVLEADGANMSVGERSLLSLARALVKDATIVIMDEATASVDLETDRMIQETIQNQFKDKTLICIAHRLRTVISYDRILVLDAGKVQEFGSPLKLFDDEASIFRSLCEKSGISRSEILSGM